MLKLEKITVHGFNDFYAGRNGAGEVTCILDDYCARYMVLVPGKHGMKVQVRREYNNADKERCFRNAERVLNK